MPPPHLWKPLPSQSMHLPMRHLPGHGLVLAAAITLQRRLLKPVGLVIGSYRKVTRSLYFSVISSGPFVGLRRGWVCIVGERRFVERLPIWLRDSSVNPGGHSNRDIMYERYEQDFFFS